MVLIVATVITYLSLLAVLVSGDKVAVFRTDQYVYDTSPTLRIRGTGFDVKDYDIILELSAYGQYPGLRKDKDYILSKDPSGDGIVLKLLNNRK